MAKREVQRRLAAIVAADVVGYSRLVGADEEGTITRLSALRDELIDTSIAKHHGRVVKTTGDGVLVEFPSVVDAVRNAVEVQRALAERNAEVPGDRRIEFRVGVNLGDIVVQGDDILGDGVNVAARLEGLAKPGGICIPRKVFHEVRNKLDVGYEFIGEQKVKNIETPVPVYRVLLEPDAAGKVIGERRLRLPRWQLAAVAAAVVAAVAVGAVWWQSWKDDVEPVPPPDKPSVAVLPFRNLTGGLERDYLADGLTEHIITSLSKIPNLFVIARHSAFTYKGKSVDVRRTAQDLGVRNILEGSIQHSGDKLRISARLVDAIKGHNLWVESYDRDFKDILALQAEIALKIVAALDVKLVEGDMAGIQRTTTANPEAYEVLLRGRHYFDRKTKGDNARARQLFEQAIELDPGFTAAWVRLANTYWMDARVEWSEPPRKSLEQAADAVTSALRIDKTYPGAYVTLSQIHLVERKYDQAIAAAEKAVALAPNHADAVLRLATTLMYAGRPEEAIPRVKEAMRLNPYYPPLYLGQLGRAYMMTGQYQEAIDALEERRARQPNSYIPLYYLAIVYTLAGKQEKALASAAELSRVRPDYTVKLHARITPLKNPAQLVRELEALRNAGVPE